MKTLTLKIPELLEAQLTTFAQKRGINKSSLVREALLKYFSYTHPENNVSFLNLAEDLAGSIEGPSDLSHNPDYLREYGQ